MRRPGFGAGDFLASVIVVIGLTIVLFLTEAYLVVGFEALYQEWRYRKAVSEWAQKGEPDLVAQFVRSGDESGNRAKHFLTFGLILVPLAAIGIALACIPPLRSLMHRIGLRRSRTRKATAKSPNRPLRIYLKMLIVSQILAVILYVTMIVGILVSAS
jgi:hypothetical protein